MDYRGFNKLTPMEMLAKNLQQVKDFKARVNMDVENFAVPLSKVESKMKRFRKAFSGNILMLKLN